MAAWTRELPFAAIGQKRKIIATRVDMLEVTHILESKTALSLKRNGRLSHSDGKVQRRSPPLLYLGLDAFFRYVLSH